MSKYKKLSYINLYLISILPIGLLIGSFISNLLIVLIVIFFLLDLKKKNNFFFLNDTNFYFLLLINLYLILNSIFISENTQSLLKAIGFLRFIILTYAIYFYFQLWKTKILRFWFIIFIVVTIDIIFELILGFNLIGNETIFKGRIASFTGDELKIGGYYFGFILLSLIFVEEKKKYFIVLSIIFFFVAMLIGERSNFLKIFTMYFLFILFFTNLKF